MVFPSWLRVVSGGIGCGACVCWGAPRETSPLLSDAFCGPQALLKERGVSADGVMEKTDLVTLASESFHLPVLEVPEVPEVEAEAATENAKGRMGDSELDEMLRKLQRETGQGFRVFKPGDDIDDFLASEGIKKSKKGSKKRTAGDTDEL